MLKHKGRDSFKETRYKLSKIQVDGNSSKSKSFPNKCQEFNLPSKIGTLSIPN